VKIPFNGPLPFAALGLVILNQTLPSESLLTEAGLNCSMSHPYLRILAPEMGNEMPRRVPASLLYRKQASDDQAETKGERSQAYLLRESKGGFHGDS
jgi:hypothetical protein